MERRLALKLSVRAAILRNYRPDEEGRIRRGVLQAQIASSLGVPVSPKLSSIVYHELIELGVKPIAHHGDLKYKGLTEAN